MELIYSTRNDIYESSCGTEKSFIYKYTNDSSDEPLILQKVNKLLSNTPKLVDYKIGNNIAPDGKVFNNLIIMEKIQGQRLHLFDDIPIHLKHKWLRCILDNFTILHDNKIYYNDALFRNIIIHPNDNLYLMDFGNSTIGEVEYNNGSNSRINDYLHLVKLAKILYFNSSDNIVEEEPNYRSCRLSDIIRYLERNYISLL